MLKELELNSLGELGYDVEHPPHTRINRITLGNEVLRETNLTADMAIDSFHCHATKINWKPSSGRSQESEML